jgi:hypothetical protein
MKSGGASMLCATLSLRHCIRQSTDDRSAIETWNHIQIRPVPQMHACWRASAALLLSARLYSANWIRNAGGMFTSRGMSKVTPTSKRIDDVLAVNIAAHNSLVTSQHTTPTHSAASVMAHECMKWHLLPNLHERVADQRVHATSLRSDVGAGVPLRCDVGAGGASTREVFWKEGAAVREEESGSAGHSSSDSAAAGAGGGRPAERPALRLQQTVVIRT